MYNKVILIGRLVNTPEVVYEDDRHISFVYENDELIYEEEK